MAQFSRIRRAARIRSRSGTRCANVRMRWWAVRDLRNIPTPAYDRRDMTERILIVAAVTLVRVWWLWPDWQRKRLAVERERAHYAEASRRRSDIDRDRRA